MHPPRRSQRRAFLRAVVGAAVVAPALTACDLLQPDPPPPPDPLTGFYLDTLALAALYETDPRPVAGPIRDAHRAHAAALAAIMYPPPSPTPVPPSAAPSAAPATPASVREAEQKAWQKAVDACLTAPAERATLLGEIAAARACHLEVLR